MAVHPASTALTIVLLSTLLVGCAPGGGADVVRQGAPASPESSGSAAPPARDRQALLAIRDRITEDMAILRDQGLDITMWGLNAPETRVRVGVVSDPHVAEQVLQDRYGPSVYAEFNERFLPAPGGVPRPSPTS